jgi:hypothetical protein
MTHIIGLKWGEVITKDNYGVIRTWKDCMITPNGPQNWDWKLDGTKHEPGVTIAALLALKDCTHIVVSMGMHERLKVSPEARAYLEALGIPYHILESTAAVGQYTHLLSAGEVRVGLLLHSTC